MEPQIDACELFDYIANETKDEIASFLEERDLGRLAQTCWNWYFVATPHLYSNNAKFGNSTAVQWASRQKGCRQREKAAHRVLDLAVTHGADVNAIYTNRVFETSVHVNPSHFGFMRSALHIAAASGNETMVQKLLEHGADVRALGSGLNMPDRDIFGDLSGNGEMIRFKRAFYKCLSRMYWLPLLQPLIQGYENIVRMLVDAGAPPQLAVSDRQWDRDPNRDVVTVYHVFAALPPKNYQDDMFDLRQALFNKYRQAINAALPRVASMCSALHISLQLERQEIFSALLQAGADVEVSTDLGRTPLMCAIKACADGPPAERRKFLMQSVANLIKHRANVNRRSHPAAAETPLICSIPATFIHFDDAGPRSNPCAGLIKVVDMLIQHGARINDRNSEGRTAIHKLWEEVIFLNGEHKSLWKLLEHFVDKGADINLPVAPQGPTILRELLVKEGEKVEPDHQAKHLFKFLVRLGAAVKDYEADDVFRLWIRRKWLRSGYDFMQHREHLSQEATNQGFLYAFEKQDTNLLQYLECTSLNPTNGSQLVEVAVARVPKHKFWEKLDDLEFDPNWRSSEGLSFIHIIVKKLGNGACNVKLAMKQAEFFIEKGTSLLTEDPMGLTAIQQLRRLEQPKFDNLLVLLVNERDDERGEY